MTRTDRLARVADVLRAGKRFLATTHVRPDGDAIGSLLAFRRGLELSGREVCAVLQDEVPAAYLFLPGSESLSTTLPSPAEAAGFDAGISLDCDGLDRTGSVGPLLEATGMVVDIDHHAGTKAFGDVRCVESDACCTGELVLELLTEHLGVTPDREVATCLFASHAYDTGRFTHRNTSARAFRNAALLLELGAEPEAIVRKLFETRSLARVRLRGIALTRASVDPASGAAWSWIAEEDFTSTGALGADTDGIVDELRATEGCTAAVFVSELAAGDCRVSIRVRDSELDAARVCAGFGGGGHRRAAGCSITGEPRAVGALVLSAIAGQLDREVVR